MFKASGLAEIDVETGVIVFEPRTFSPYFLEIGHAAFQYNVITTDELQKWQGDIQRLLGQDELFCTITYFLVIGRVEDLDPLMPA